MNFRITDMQAAIGLAQMQKLPLILEDRARKWRLYSEGLQGIGDIQVMDVDAKSSLAAFRFPILSRERERIAEALTAAGVEIRRFFYPMHLQPKLRNEPPLSLPVAESLYERGICLPIHYRLSEQDILTTIAAIRGAFGR
jgi:perosamine synthetase